MAKGLYYTPRRAVIRLLMLAAYLAAFSWLGHKTGASPAIQVLGKGLFMVTLLFVPFMLKDLYAAIRFKRRQKRALVTIKGR